MQTSLTLVVLFGVAFCNVALALPLEGYFVVFFLVRACWFSLEYSLFTLNVLSYLFISSLLQ